MTDGEKTKDQLIEELVKLQQQLRELQGKVARGDVAEKAVQWRLKLEETIADISSQFARVTDFNRVVDTALCRIGELAGASRAYLFLFRENKAIVDNTHEWCADGVSPQKHNLQNLPSAKVEWWMNELKKGNTIHIPDVSQMPEDAQAEREAFEAQSIKSLLVLPIFIGDNLSGFIGLDNIESSGSWHCDDVFILRITAELIGNALERTRVLENLKVKENALSSSINGIAIANLDSRLTYVNEAFLRMWGYTDGSEVHGKHIITFWQDQEHASRVVDTLQQEGKWFGEMVAMRKDGSSFVAELSASIVTDETGRSVRMMVSFVDVTKRKQMEDELRILATTDPLTGVLNRGYGLLLLGNMMRSAKRDESKLSICYVDVDGLKDINDTYGHREGDDLLKSIAQLIKESLREVDVVCRLGGDEFLLILAQCPSSTAGLIWQRIMEKVNVYNSREIKPYKISLSHGCAEYDPAHPRSIDHLLAMADQEMYLCKKAKSNSNTGHSEQADS